MPDDKAILAALQKFAEAVTAKANALTRGEPEEQLRNPFETFVQEVGDILTGLKGHVVCKGESLLPGRLGKPDFAVLSAKLLAGYAELKAPGVGANTARFTGHNARQAKRFAAIPNLLYCDGNEWGLYRSGKRDRPIVRLSGDVATDGKQAATFENAAALGSLFTDFLSWQPIIPKNVNDLAVLLAPLCRMLRDDVTDALKASDSPLVHLAKDWRDLLFPDTGDEQFADAYAQTITFALLLAQTEGAHPLDLDSAVSTLAADHSLLSRALQVLTDPNAQEEISASLKLLIRVISQVPPKALHSPKQPWLFRYPESLPFPVREDPWLFFYEVFLAAYDPKLRKDAGAYYTPVQVVLAQVRLIDDLLKRKLGKDLGFANPDVITLDPAAGTGTYLLAVIDYAMANVHSEQGEGAVPGKATALARNIYGFEIMVGPFAVSELRVSRSLRDWGAKLPKDGTNIFLTDTLESPNAVPPQMGLWYKDITEQHKRALHVKAAVPVIVCLGNPPYDRTENPDPERRATVGNWVRWGDDRKGSTAILKDFLTPARVAGHGKHLRNLYNLYVYFWRWALWKVFESGANTGPGVVSFISASSYLYGDAFCGMREHMRRLCDEIWILDLGGDGRGTRKSENVFAIQTPVAIAVAVRYGEADKDTPAKVHYTRIDGTRNEKLKTLDAVTDFASLAQHDCPDDWQAPFRPAGIGIYFEWPLFVDILPWVHPGVKLDRTWPIGTTPGTLKARWSRLLSASDRAGVFGETRDRKISGTYLPLQFSGKREKAIGQLDRSTSAPDVVRYGYRSLDRQWILADSRLGDVMRPVLWNAHGERQVYLTTLLNHPLGGGPALTATNEIPDLHHFRGSYGAKEVVPLYRDSACKEANILPGLLDMLAETYERSVTPEDFLAYVYGVLAQPAFTQRYADELGTRELRVPLTKDAKLFAQVSNAGAKLLWLHTYGERFVPKGKHKGHVPNGAVRCVKPVPGEQENYPENYEYNDATKTLRVGAGEFAPVAPEVYGFEVSGLKVVQSWLGYRMKRPKGKKSSPLDDITPATLGGWPAEFTTELLELLGILEATIAEYPAQAELLDAVVNGQCFKADELPPVPDAARKAPARPSAKGLFDAAEDDAE